MWLVLAVLFSQYTPFSYAATVEPSLDAKAVEKVAHSKHWLDLLHYHRTFPFYRKRSQVAAGPFFFSPEGRTDPEAELRATVQAFDDPTRRMGRHKAPAQCEFPERYHYLKQELALKIADEPCPDLEEFMRRMNPGSATLVFSSAYQNNPGSMFGHTFIRINSKERRGDLLDNGVSYAAAIGDDGGLKFAVWGIFGGYYGQFSVTPYYVKVNEYNHAESRDIWEYDLGLSEEEVRRLLRHLWELDETALFHYYFFDENCAYILLKLLEVAKPEWNLVGTPLYAIPGESVKALMRIPGAVRDIHFRPSLRKKMLNRYEHLSSSQKQKVFAVLGRREPVSSVSDVQTIEGLSEYLYYQKRESTSTFTADDDRLLREVLVRRSRLGSSNDEQPISMNDRFMGSTRPDIGHDPFRLGFSTGFQSRSGNERNRNTFYELQFKVAYHDLLNNDQGYTPFSRIDFPAVTLRYTEGGQKLNIEQVLAVGLTSLTPFNFLEKSASWRFQLDDYSPKDYGCTTCHNVRLVGGGGFAFNVFTRNALFYSLGGLDIEGSTNLWSGYRFGPRWENGFLFNPWIPYKLYLSHALQTDLFQSDRQAIFNVLSFEHSLSFGRNWDLRAMIEKYFPTRDAQHQYHEEKLTLNYSF